MNLPVATARPMVTRARTIDYAILVVALAAFASSFLPMLDSETLYYCGCTETVHLSDVNGGVPVLLYAAMMVIRVVTGHRGGKARRGFEIAAIVGILLVLAVLGLLGFEGTGHYLGLLAHTTLLVLVVVRWFCARAARRD